MAWGGLLLAAALTAGGPDRAPAVRFQPDVVVAAPEVRLGQVADLSAVPAMLRDRAGEVVILRLTAEQPAATLSTVGLASRIRALMPALSPWLAAGDTGSISLRLAPTASADPVRPAPPVESASSVTPGQRLFVHARIGAVEVTREVTALQPGRPGRGLFVRAADGAVFAVKLEDLSS